MTAKQIRPFRFHQVAIIALGALFLSHFIAISLLAGDSLTTTIVTDLFTLVEQSLAVTSLALTARQLQTNRRERLAWSLLALAVLTTMLLTFADLGINAFGFDPAVFQVAQLLAISSIPLFVAGLLLLPSAPTHPGENLKLILDISGAMVGSALIFWAFLFGPQLAGSETDPLTLGFSLVSPAGDLAILWAVFVLLLRPSSANRRVPLFFIMTGMVTLVITDAFYGIQTLAGSFKGGGAVDLGWALTSILVTLAGVWMITSQDLQAGGEPAEKLSQPAKLPIWAPYLPYVFLVLSYGLLIWDHSRPLPIPFVTLSLGVGAIIVVILARQIIGIWENTWLYREAQQEIRRRQQVEIELRQTQDELEDRVQARTVELAAANQTLRNDITERKQMEDQIRASLHEKEILLKEIHHRVKNNLQIVSSLLNLQSEHIKDEHALQMFRDSQHRIRSMALIHEKFYQSKDLTHINMREYIQSLTSYLFRSFGSKAANVGLHLHVPDVLLTIDIAVPCGLIINELVSNSLKHAFPPTWVQEHPNSSPEITLDLAVFETQSYELKLGDNGRGFPGEVDFTNTNSLGLELVNMLVEQINATISLDSRGRTEFIIQFADKNSLLAK